MRGHSVWIWLWNINPILGGQCSRMWAKKYALAWSSLTDKVVPSWNNSFFNSCVATMTDSGLRMFRRKSTFYPHHTARINTLRSCAVCGCKRRVGFLLSAGAVEITHKRASVCAGRYGRLFFWAGGAVYQRTKSTSARRCRWYRN